MGYTSTVLQRNSGLSGETLLMFVVIMEHIMVLVKIFISAAIPDTPKYVREQEALNHYYADLALKRSQGATAHTEGPSVEFKDSDRASVKDLQGLLSESGNANIKNAALLKAAEEGTRV